MNSNEFHSAAKEFADWVALQPVPNAEFLVYHAEANAWDNACDAKTPEEMIAQAICAYRQYLDDGVHCY